MKRLFLGGAAAAVFLAGHTAASMGGLKALSADALIPAPYKNCAALNKKYPHGVGKVTARDRTTGTPVTTFKRSNSLYAVAISRNKALDRDKDGIACETA